MNDQKPQPRRLLYAVACALLLASALLTSVTLAQTGVANRGVQKRMITMATARTAIETLASMMAGRVRFDPRIARDARRDLIKATRKIPSVFKKQHTDPLSRAKPDIWWNWSDFKTRADTANRAAKQLNADRLEYLRSTLPLMINACLSCHQKYRRPR